MQQFQQLYDKMFYTINFREECFMTSKHCTYTSSMVFFIKVAMLSRFFSKINHHSISHLKNKKSSQHGLDAKSTKNVVIKIDFVY